MLNNTTIYTSKDKYFDFNNFDSYKFEIEEIVNTLSNLCRFGGHLNQFYSVLHHSMFACEITKLLYPEIKLQTLVHDFHETYITDIPTPLINYLGKEKIENLKDKIDHRIYATFDIPFLTGIQKVYLKECDKIAYEFESNFLGNMPIKITYEVDIVRALFEKFNDVRNMDDPKKDFMERYWYDL